MKTIDVLVYSDSSQSISMKITNIQTGISVNGHGSSYFKLKT